MKVLLVHNKYQYAGGEDHVFNTESTLLRQHGHEVDQLIFDSSDNRPSFKKLVVGILSVYNSGSARKLKDKILAFSPDVIHVHNFLPAASPSIFYEASRHGIPIGLTLHNYRLICPSATLFHDGNVYEEAMNSMFPWDAVKRGVYRNSKLQTAGVAIITTLHNLIGTWRRKVDFYIALTQFSKKKFVDSCLSDVADKIMVKPNFVVDEGENNIERKPFFLFLGRLTEEKGINILVKAAKLYSFPLVIAGDGPLRGVIEEEAARNKNISFLGQQGKDRVEELLKTCTALIFPSIWYEGFPIAILEAFAASTPVIASRMGSMAEIIQDGANGLHFDPGDEKDLVARIVEIHSFPEIGRWLGRRGRETYLRNYTPEKNYSQLMKIYRSAIASKKAQPYMQADKRNQTVGIATRLGDELV
jgi:glycosyltransferase involved in cell wall biosynthesis